MEYKAYGKKASTSQRMTRKRMRVTVFTFNKRAAKLRRKEARLARQAVVENENPSY